MTQRSATDWAMEALAFVALAGMIAIIAALWTELPAQVPRHFGASGQPDRWGGKNGLLLLPLITIGLYILMTVASRHQRLINLPMAIDRDAPEVRSLLRSMSITIKLALVLILLYIEWAAVGTAIGRSSGLGKGFLPISLIAVFFPLAFYMQKLRKYKK